MAQSNRVLHNAKTLELKNAKQRGTFIKQVRVDDALERGPLGRIGVPALLNELRQLRRALSGKLGSSAIDHHVVVDFCTGAMREGEV
jgi:hypothetical protein